MHPTLPLLEHTDFPSLTRRAVETVQINLGYRCNQSCLHCHVNAGPHRTEAMSAATVNEILTFIDATPSVTTIDLTGGAPELNPEFRRLVALATERGLRVIDRCNLSILFEPGQDDLARFLADHRVEVVASLPCYLEQNVDRQRGSGVFRASIAGLCRLNAFGYGSQPRLPLNLVYNPQGAVLPPPQPQLEADYRQHLNDVYGIVFSRLLVMTNMPIQRFGSTLISKGQFQGYLDLLRQAHCSGNLDGVMCRSQLSVDWQGHAYDCDFNQMLGLPLADGDSPTPISRLRGCDLRGRRINVAGHCYGCTAGQGSSCGGALAVRPSEPAQSNHYRSLEPS